MNISNPKHPNNKEWRKKISVALKKYYSVEPHHSKGGSSWNKDKKCPWAGKNGFKKGSAPWNKGKKYPQITGKNNVNWNGGVSSENKRLRGMPGMRNWRKSIFQRDHYTCQHCGQIGGQLEADHIKPFSTYPELRLELSNGRTLCKSCHSKTSTYKRRALKFTKETTQTNS